MSEQFAIIGGDDRLIYTALSLEEKGYRASYCAEKPIETFPKLKVSLTDECLKSADCVILPLPVTKNGCDLNSVYAPKMRIAEVFQRIPKNTRVYVGKADLAVAVAAKDNGISFTDYYADEAFLIQNASLTAEGAIAVIIEALPISVAHSSITIFGYGRCAAHLARRLILLDASVSVVARSISRLAQAKADGASVFLPDKSAIPLSVCDIAVNTVPAPVIGYNEARVLENRPIIELADISGIAVGVKANVLRAAGLPGKYSPKSAGELIAETVLRMNMGRK